MTIAVATIVDHFIVPIKCTNSLYYLVSTAFHLFSASDIKQESKVFHRSQRLLDFNRLSCDCQIGNSFSQLSSLRVYVCHRYLFQPQRDRNHIAGACR